MTKRLPEVTVYSGPMGSGKTTALFGKMGELQHLEIPFAAYRPGVDVRDQIIAPRGYVSIDPETHAPNCITVDSLENIPAEELAAKDINTILIEEWFMFGFDESKRPIPDLYLRTMGRWAMAGVERVYAAGLDIAANGREFSLITDARKYGAEIIAFTARCEYPTNGGGKKRCSEIARNSQIYDVRDGLTFDMESLPQLLPEGNREFDRYRAVCPEHLVLPESEKKPFTQEPEHVQLAS